MRIKVTIEVDVDESFSLDLEDEKKWFESEVITGNGTLMLYSNEIGDMVGAIKKVTNLEYLSNE